MTKNTPEKFWARVNQSQDVTACWEWTGHCGRGGYGTAYFGGWRSAHRVAFELTYGGLPKLVCHRCDNRKCCNPNHLFGGTHKDNTQDARRKGRLKRVKILVGEQTSAAKLKEHEVLEIIATPFYKGVLQFLSKKFNISPQTVCCIRKGRIWRHLPRE